VVFTDEAVSNLGSLGGADSIGDLLDEMFHSRPTCVDGVILKSLKREFKLKELNIFIAYPKLNRLYIQPIITLWT